MKVLANQKDRANFSALLKILAILVIKLQGGKIKPLKETIGDINKAAALEFLKKNGADGKLFAGLYLNILKKSSDVEPFANPFITDLRKIINGNRLKHSLEAMSTDSKQVLEPILTLLGNPESTNALSTLNRRISLLKEPAITTKFDQVYREVVSQRSDEDNKPSNQSGSKKLIDPDLDKVITAPTASNTIDNISLQIDQVLFNITKKKGATSLTAEQKTKAQSTTQGQELLKRLTSLRKQLSDYKLSEIRNVVAQVPNHLMSTSDLTAALIRRGIKRLTIPPAFQTSDTIFMNIDGKLCDSEGRVAVRQGWQADAEIRVNPSYSHDTPKKNWLFAIVTNGGSTKNYIQTLDKIAEKRATNFNKVSNTLQQDIKQVKSKWRNMMLGKPDDEKTVYANIAEFVYQTTSRIGAGEGNTAGSRTYGASNFLVKHVDTKLATDSRLKIVYPVKSGKNETFILSAKASDLGGSEDVRWVKSLIKFILTKCKGKSGDDLVFTIKNGERVNSTRFNSYLNSIDLPFTAKTFRTMRGTELAIEALDQAEIEFKRLQKATNKPLPASTVNALFDAACQEVGSLLGHIRRNKSGGEETTGNTAIKSYIDPNVMLSFYKNTGYSAPSKVIQACKAAGIEV